jgi:hypothetical protein
MSDHFLSFFVVLLSKYLYIACNFSNFSRQFSNRCTESDSSCFVESALQAYIYSEGICTSFTNIAYVKINPNQQYVAQWHQQVPPYYIHSCRPVSARLPPLSLWWHWANVYVSGQSRAYGFRDRAADPNPTLSVVGVCSDGCITVARD